MADKLPFFASEWEACDPEGFAARADKPETVLETISRVRLSDVQAASAVLPLEELKAKVEAEAAPAIDFYERLSRVDGMAVLAEIKRASPSKAWIDPDCVALEQGVQCQSCRPSVCCQNFPNICGNYVAPQISPKFLPQFRPSVALERGAQCRGCRPSACYHNYSNMRSNLD